MDSPISGWNRGLFCSPPGMAKATQSRLTATPAARCKTRLKTAFTARFEPLENRHALAGDGLLPAFDIGTPTVIDIWVDPSAGNDAGSGASRDQSLRSLSAAWGRVPIGVTLTTGVRINLVAGTYPESIVPNYWEARHGTLAAPVIIRAADGAGTARLPTVNVFDCSFLYFDGLDISSGGGDVLHFDACSHILVRNTTVRGTGVIASYAVPQETLKVNQSQFIFIEGCDISGAWDNAVDFVAVQYGHVVGSKIHRSGDWAMYAKGGSAYLTVTGNEFYDAGTGGFTAGQGTGFEFMAAPWLHYEAYDIKFTNNVIHDTEGAGIGVNGGYNILMASNTLYRVGGRSHVIEAVFGARTCDGDRTTTGSYLAQGGWGTTVVGGDEPIPNRNVFIYNNIVLNPTGYASQWQQFAVATPRTPSAGSNIPSPARADTNLQFRGNVIWNGPTDHPLGIESEALAADMLAHNSINTVRPLLVDPIHGDYSLAAGYVPPAAYEIPDFTWSDAPASPAVPAGTLDNRVAYDHLGVARTGSQAAGAFGAAGGVIVPPPFPPVPPPAPPIPVTASFAAIPVLRNTAVAAARLTFSAAVTGFDRSDVRLTRAGVIVGLPAVAVRPVAGAGGTTFEVVGLRIATAPVGNYVLIVRALGSGIADAAGNGLAAAIVVRWTVNRTPPTAVFRAVAAVTAGTLSSLTIVLSKAVTGVTIDDFMLTRGGAALPLSGATVSTLNNRTFTIAGIRGTHVVGSYAMRLKREGTGIIDAAGNALATPAGVAWRMTRTAAAAFALFDGTPGG